MGYPWQTALGAVFISGALFVILSVAGARQAIVKAIPLSLKFAITAGIGAFLAFLGFKSAGIVVANEATLVGLGSLTSPTAWLAIIGLLGTAVLMYKKVKGAILYGIIGTSLIAIITRIPVYSGPDGDLGAVRRLLQRHHRSAGLAHRPDRPAGHRGGPRTRPVQRRVHVLLRRLLRRHRHPDRVWPSGPATSTPRATCRGPG